MPTIAMKYVDFLNPEVVSDVERTEKFFPLDEDEVSPEENIVDIYKGCQQPGERFKAFLEHLVKVPKELRKDSDAEADKFAVICKKIALYKNLYNDLVDETQKYDVITDVLELTLQNLDQAIDSYALWEDIDEMCPLVIDQAIIEKDGLHTNEENELLNEFCIAAKLAISAMTARTYQSVKEIDSTVGGLVADFGYALLAAHFPEDSRPYEAIGGDTGRVAKYKKALLTI